MMKVLWFDDEHQKFIPLKEEAILKDIELIGFNNAADGLKELEANFNLYDALIVDGKFFINKEATNTSDNAFGEVAKTLDILKMKGKVLPAFIYSGQTNFVLDKHSFVELFKETFQEGGKVFNKNNDDDFPLLLEMIKTAVQDNPNSQIRQQFNSVFQAIKGIEALEKHQSTLLDILKEIDSNQDYTKVRKIIESLFKALSDVHIIPEGFTAEKGWINGTSLFISAKHSDYDFTDPDFIHSTIRETVYSVLKIVQDASHNEGGLTYKIDEYSRSYKSGYLYKSIVYGLLEILSYFGELIRNNQDKTVNQSRWRKKDNSSMIEGVVCQDEKGNYYVEQYLVNYKSVPTYINIGETMIIEMFAENTNPNTKLYYPYFVQKFKKKES
ncbi:hypothetical protein [Empedobacter sp. R132-2]|uniref:hypothetical protein n=1 Tax=Empedobacter sp. R132-2 TaxID=2746740 RepID=UPI0025760C98|nr:hypothetical protein [Empedobacter sp. R132-2]MDM1138400.1 hypothetical protein [Empedobacter sp. R132-2]